MEEITITKKEYDELIEAKVVLDALYLAGVDNWDGYDYAIDLLEHEES